MADPGKSINERVTDVENSLRDSARKRPMYGRIRTMIGIVAGAMAIIGSSVGAYVFVDDRYVAVADYKAQTEEIVEGLRGLNESIQSTNKRLEQKIIEGKLAYWEQRRDQYKVRTESDDCGDYRAECLEAQRQINMLRRQLEAYR